MAYLSFNKCMKNWPNPSSPPNPTIDEMPLLWNPTTALQYVRIFSLHRRPMLLHLMTLVSFQLCRIKFGQLARIFWANGLLPPPWALIMTMPIIQLGKERKWSNFSCKVHINDTEKWPCSKLPHLVYVSTTIHLPPSKYNWHPTWAFIT